VLANLKAQEQTPPGGPVMKRLKAEIKYRVDETDRGGRVLITTSNPDALGAVNESGSAP